MKRILVAVVLGSIATGALAADGAAIYASKCAACHGKDGKGTPVGIKMGAKDLAVAKDEAAIVAVVSNGRGKMSAFKSRLSAEEIQAVAKYVKDGLK